MSAAGRRVRQCQFPRTGRVCLSRAIIDAPLHAQSAVLAELCRFHCSRRPSGRHSVPMQRQHRLAYNRWPDRFSLYDDGSGRDWSSPHNVRVSFDRPYGKYRQIYDNPQSVGSEYTSVSNSARLLARTRRLRRHLLLQQRHAESGTRSEVQSISERRTRRILGPSTAECKGLIESGVNALFLSGNSVCWVSPFLAARDGRPIESFTAPAPMVAPRSNDMSAWTAVTR